MKIALAALIGLMTLNASAQTTQCSSTLASLAQDEKRLAYLEADGVMDDSAPRQTNRQIKITNHLLKMNMTMQFAIAGKCNLPKEPYSSAGYMSSAYACTIAEATARVTNSKVKIPDCDDSKWVKAPIKDKNAPE